MRRLDHALARFEGWLTVGVLLLMVLTAAFQALVRNLSRFDVQWASELLTDMDWGDSLLRKATLWLAFLGASLATHKRKHIGIDVLQCVAPPRARYGMLALSHVIAGVITLGLAVSFSAAVRLNLTERPIEYEVLGEAGPLHVCDASDARIAAIEDLDKPVIFCAFRKALTASWIPAETPGPCFQLIVPLMFGVMALRLVFQGLGAVRVLLGGPEAIAQAEQDSHRRQAAARDAVGAGTIERQDPEVNK